MNKRKVEIVVISILCVFILVLGTYLFFLKDSNNNETLETNIETSEMDNIEIIDDSLEDNTKYNYLNKMDFSKLDESDWLVKYEDDKFISSIGIDVSEYNGLVNFYTLKENGVDFVMLRVGWRGYTEGGLHKDKYFEDYYAEAKDAGLKIGYYFFSQAINEKEVIEEADFVIENIKDKDCDLFVAYDMESVGNLDSRTYYLTQNEVTHFAKKFSEIIKDNQYEPIIYTNHDWAYNHYHMKEFGDTPIWYAQYNGYPNVFFNYVMWQYTASATIDGSSLIGRTDLNLMLEKKHD